MKVAVFLDRDGVLNQAVVRNGRPYPPDDLQSFTIIEGVKDACARLKAAGFSLVVVTNQPDVATGKQSMAVVEQFHDILTRELALDAIYGCYAVDGPNVDCYKPKPGMLYAAARDLSLDIKQSWLVGDRWRDIGAGQAAGCRTIFIDYGYQEQRPVAPDFVVASLSEAADIILKPGSVL